MTLGHIIPAQLNLRREYFIYALERRSALCCPWSIIHVAEGTN